MKLLGGLALALTLALGACGPQTDLDRPEEVNLWKSGKSDRGGDARGEILEPTPVRATLPEVKSERLDTDLAQRFDAEPVAAPQATCAYGDESYAPGEVFPAADGCNLCWCGSDGDSNCTAIECSS